MKENSTQQEILLMTATTFAARQWADKDENNGQGSGKDPLQNACWNGMLKDMLPEIYQHDAGKNLYLWRINEGLSFLELNLGEFPADKENEHSINPHYFLSHLNLS
jgi:hypothetical protein